MIYFFPVCGLANRMRAMASIISLSSDIDQEVVVFWYNDKSANCFFSDLFKPIPHINVIDKIITHYHHDELMVDHITPFAYNESQDWEILEEMEVRSLHMKNYDFRQLKNENVIMLSNLRFYPKSDMYNIFNPVDSIQHRIDNECKHFDNNTIGIHIRRTDNVRSKIYSPIELFVEAIEQEIRQNENANFYVASDCVITKKQLKAKFGNRIRTNYLKAERTNRRGIQQALTELYILSKTKEIWGSFFSSFSETAAHIGKIKGVILHNRKDAL